MPFIIMYEENFNSVKTMLLVLFFQMIFNDKGNILLICDVITIFFD